ncbi:chaplin family protein [Catenulispora yoronensis]
MVQLPINAPVQACGDSVAVVGFADEAAGNACVIGGAGPTPVTTPPPVTPPVMPPPPVACPPEPCPRSRARRCWARRRSCRRRPGSRARPRSERPERPARPGLPEPPGQPERFERPGRPGRPARRPDRRTLTSRCPAGRRTRSSATPGTPEPSDHRKHRYTATPASPLHRSAAQPRNSPGRSRRHSGTGPRSGHWTWRRPPTRVRGGRPLPLLLSPSSLCLAPGPGVRR